MFKEKTSSKNFIRFLLLSLLFTLLPLLGSTITNNFTEAAQAASGLNIYWKNEAGATTSILRNEFSSGCSSSISNINFAWGTGAPSGCNVEGFTSFATGYIIWPGTAGTQVGVTFYDSADDGFYLTIDGSVVINNWVDQGAATYNAKSSVITKTAGTYYPIRVWHHENGGGADWRLYWSYSGQSTTIVPQASFSTTPNTYTVSFDANLGTGSPSVSSVVQASAGASVTLATRNTLARTGYTFAGWNTAANGSGTTLVAGSTYTPANSITLYAQWNSYIQYAANGATSGSPPDSTTAKSSAAVTTLATNSRTLARTNYTFGGWNTNETGTGTSYSAGLSTYASPGNITLYAQWNSTITYLGNGNTSGSTPAASSLYAGSTTLASNSGSLAKTNFTFGGWNTNETGTGTSYAAGSSYPPTGNRSLYAQWNSVITYNGNSNTGGTAPAQTTISGTGGTLATNSGNLVRSSLVFAGWNTNAAGTGTWYAAGSSYPNSGNITLYAQWVTQLSFTGSDSINVGQGVAYRSDTYTAVSGLDTKTVTYTLSPSNPGITLETRTVGATSYAYINVASTVAAGTYVDTLTATDRMGTSVNKVVTITISAPLRWLNSNPSSAATTFGRSTSLRLDVQNGFSGKTFTMVAASSPVSAGITLDTSTAASGYVTIIVASNVVIGTYLETITARDSSGTQISTLITITVNRAIELTQNGSIVGTTYSSLNFNGTNQAVRYPAGNRYQLGSNYTIEWWQYQTATTNWPRVFSMGGSYLGVSLESEYLYFWNNGWVARGPSSSASRLNQWVHFAIVSNGGNIMLYQNGKALNGSSVSGGTVTSSGAPGTANFYVGSKNAQTGESFIGRITNLMMSKRVDYSGNSTTTQNFSPATTMRVDANTVLALTAVGGASTYTDLSNSALVASQYIGPPTASNTHPGGSAAALELVTTQGVERSTAPIVASLGTGNKNFTITTNTTGVTSSLTTNQAIVTISNSATASSSTTARVAYETLTATDASGSTQQASLKLTINPPVSLSSTSLTPSTSAGIARTDTITASFGTGIKTFTYSSNPVSSGITFATATENVLVMNVARTTSSGTYIETVTATDTLGDSETIVLTLTVNEGLSLVSATGSAALTTTSGKAASIRVNAQQGSGSKTFTLTHVGTSNAGITLDTSNAASGYAILNVGSSVGAGTYLESITVTDALGSRAQLRITVTVNAALTLSYNGATSGAINLTTTAGTSLRSLAFTAALGTGNRTLTLSGKNSGISLDTSTANIGYVVLGTSLTSLNSTQPQTYSETITVTDSVSATTMRTLTIVVNPAIAMSAAQDTVTTTAGVAVTDTVTVTSGTGTGIKTFVVSVSPSVSGIALTNSNDSRTVISIANTVSAGNYVVTVTATDRVGAIASKNVNVVVNAPATFTGSGNLTSTKGYAFTSPVYSAAGGTGNLALSVISSPNPAVGTITLTSNTSPASVLVSSLVPSGSYSLTLRSTDSVGAISNFVIGLVVNEPVTLSGNKTLTKEYGSDLSQVYQTTSGTAPFSFFTSPVCTSEYSTYTGNGTNGVLGQEYIVEKFGGVGSCSWTAPQGVTKVDALVVGGGGSGGQRHGGGGGAGGLIYQENVGVTPGASTTINVGAGGAAVPALVGGYAGVQGNSGGNSQFGSIAAVGGGGGGSNSANPLSGGSGGGGGGPASGASGTVGQGNGGGTGSGSGNESTFTGGGGGGSGAGATGGNGSSSGVGGSGGAGTLISITGAAQCYAAGGGGGIASSSSTIGAGGGCGSAIGGSGAKGYTDVLAGAGINGTGSGGGGGGFVGSNNSSTGKGGSGVVIIRYPKVADTATASLLTMRTLATTPSGSIQLNAPSNLPVNVYTQTITVTDANGSRGSTPVTVTLTVTKANPVTTLFIAGGGTSVVYGSPVVLSLSTNVPGNANFKLSGTTISGCGARSSSAGLASCSWTPSSTGSAAITVTFTPNDSGNYNTITTTALNLTVVKAPAITVTFRSQEFTYTGNALNIDRGFTIRGLSTLDSITAISTRFVGTPNDLASNSYSSLTAPTLAGTYQLSADSTTSFASLTYTGGVTSNNYEGIIFESGTITINRAANVLAVNYGTGNSVVFSPNGTESPTVTSMGDGIKSFSTSTTSVCTLDNQSGELTKLSAGICSVTFDVSQGKNYLANTLSFDVTVTKAPRTVTLSSSSLTLKYGETATVTILISAESSTGTIAFSMGSSSGCTYDSTESRITATSGIASCTLITSISEGTNYLAATSSPLAITLQKADAPVVTLTPPLDIDYLEASGDPSVIVEGLKLTDTADTGNIVYTYVATGSYPYNSSTKPVNANTYTVTPSNLNLSSGSLANYQSPTYTSAQWTIRKIQQETITVTTAFQDSLTVPVDIQFAGGSTGGAGTLIVIPGGTASNCYAVGLNLRASSTGTCLIRVQIAGNQNYLDHRSETITMTIANFVAAVFNFDSAAGSTGITITSEVPIIKDADVCSANCVPTITSVTPSTFQSGDLLTIVGVDFVGATAVIFNRNVMVTNFQVDSNTQITVLVPNGLNPGVETGSISVRNADKISFRFSGLTITG